MGKNRNTGIGVGSSSILVIFVVLCLTTFATLSLVSANGDYKLTRKAVQATQEYYLADGQAVELCAQLAQALEPFSSAIPDTDAMRNTAASLGWQTDAGSLAFSYTFMINERQNLDVTVDFSGGGLKVTRWQVVSASQWEDGESLELWDGGGLAAMPDLG